MKRILLVLLAVTMIASVAMAGEREKGSDDKGIKWLTIDEVQVAMKKKPKKVYVDIYTDWCGWCKVMDKKTYTNADLVNYVNKKFYAVKFDAEQKESVMFMGKTYEFKPENRAHELAVQLLNGQLSYPTTVFLMENFQSPSAVPGYIDVHKMETILTYLGENKYQSQKWEEYMKDYKPGFKLGAESSAPVSGAH